MHPFSFVVYTTPLELLLRQPQATINPTVVKKVLQLHWSKDSAADGAKINPDAAVLVAEYLRLFVIGEEPTRTAARPNSSA